MRIVSLVPSSTEMLFALGLGDSVVGVTHECDWPTEAGTLPHLTGTSIPEGLDPAEVDAAVKETVGRGDPLYRLDREALEMARPDLIVAQEVCAVCAVSYDDVVQIAEELPGRPDVVRQDPVDLGGVLDDVVELASVAGVPDRGIELKDDLERRLDAVRQAASDRTEARVVALEWLDPPYTAGHWMPEMVSIAGGRDLIGRAGEKSSETTWENLEGIDPDFAIVMPCGYELEPAVEQGREYLDSLARLEAGEVHAVDACASFSRPGPRLVDGIELLASIFHPGTIEPPKTVRSIRIA